MLNKFLKKKYFQGKGATTFSLLDKSTNGIANLSQDLTINGSTVSPTFRYEGVNATTSTWTATVGENLTGAGSGGTVGLDTPFISSDKAVNPDGTRYWDADNSDFADITTEDIVVEMVYRESGNSAAAIAGKYFTSGWLLYTPGVAGRKDFRILNASGGTNIVASGLVTGVWYHIIYFLDRSGSGVAYVNGVAKSAADISSITDSLTTNRSTNINSYNDGTGIGDNNIAYLAMWKKDAWLDTHLQADIAKERFFKLTGFYPTKAKGTAIPTSCTRATVGYLDKEILGAELLPSTDPTSGWTTQNSSVVLDAGVSHPEGATVYAISEDGTAAALHRMFEGGMTATTGETYKFSVDVKAANRNWLSWGSTVSPVQTSFFDVTNGVVGTTTNIHSAQIRSLGDGWYRCSLNLVASALTPNNVLYIAEANNDFTFDGLSQVSLYIANPSVKAFTRQLFPVGDNWPRICQRTDSNGTSITGYLSETASTNLITYSEEFDNAAWTKTRSSITADSVVGPDGETTADTLVEDGTAASNHTLADTTVFTATGGTAYIFSLYAKAINRSWIRLSLYSVTDGFTDVDFNLSAGTVGTESNNDDAGIEDWGDGWFRCWIKDTRVTAENNLAYIFIGEGDNDVTFDGLNQDSLYIWGAQVEEDVVYPSSYMFTSGATDTRNRDVLYYKGDDGNIKNNQQGSMTYDILTPDIANPSASETYTWLALSDGGSSSDRFLLYSNLQKARVFTAATGGSGGSVIGTSDIFDNVITNLRITWKANSLKLYVDGTEEGSEDTNVGIPDDIDRIHIGVNNGDVGQPNGLVSNVKIFNKVTMKG